MARVVVDTNVVVSAAISLDGNPALIFEMIISEEVQNFTTQEIIKEIKDVLQRPKIAMRLSSTEQEFIVNTFTKFSKKINPAVRFHQVQADPDDDKFLDCAVSASAEYIISGDGHLLRLKEFMDIKIVTPAEFIKIMNKQK